VAVAPVCFLGVANAGLSGLGYQVGRCPFDWFPVVGYRTQERDRTEERFYVLEIDLPNDKLGPMTAPPARSEPEARVRLAELGLSPEEVEERIAWVRKWMATVTRQAGGKSVMWLPAI
jgi:hypothetical protein